MDEEKIEKINSEDEIEIIPCEEPEFRNKKGKKRKFRIAIIVNILILTGIFTAGYFVGTNKLLSGIISAEKVSDNSGESEAVTSDNRKELTTQEISKLVGPAVVGIVSESEIQTTYWGTSVAQASGSGIIFQKDKNDYYVLTNNHVIEDASSVTVYIAGGETLDGKVVGTDANTDLAVIKINSKEDLTVASLGNSDQVEVGERAIAIGNPLGMEFFGTVTQGIVSATNRTIEINNFTMNYIQTDAAINSGNSGGALVNAYGEVIGVNSAKISDSSVEGMGFAIPISEAKVVVSDLIQYGYVKGRPVIGITTIDITESISRRYRLPQGVMVNDVQEGSGAEKAGLLSGDIITEANGKEVTSVDELNNIKNTLKPGDKLRLKVYREGKSDIEISVVLTENNPITSK